MALRIFKESLSPPITGTLTVDGTAFDLTGHSVKFKMRAIGSDDLVVDETADVVSAAAGTVSYEWQDGDLDTAGDYLGWWEVTLSGGDVQDHPEFLIDVQEHAQPATHLCEVAEVREYLQKPTGDRDQDTVIESMIAEASRLIANYTRREFVPPSSSASARLFDLGGYALSHHRAVPVGDLSTTPTAASLIDDYGDTVSTLTVNTDLVLLPHVRLAHEPITSVRFRPDVSIAPRYTLSLTGVWGFPSIPEDVRRACITTVGIWMRREVQAFSATFNIDEGRVERPQALPSMVQGLLDHYTVPGIA